MKEINDVTAMVFGHGIDICIAQRLARDFKQVLYFSEWQKGFSCIEEAVIGDGVPGVQRVMDFWEHKEECDLFVFPDVQHSGLQLELESQGYAVWGSRKADQLELDRSFFLSKLEEVGLEVPPHQVCRGITELRSFLKEKEDQYIKVSFYRGTFETKHWRSWALDENLLDLWAIKFGAVRDIIKFLVFEPIDTPLEIGCDTYCVDGVWPDYMLHGIECKDTSYLAAVSTFEEMPDQVQEVLESLSGYFQETKMRNQFSAEIRVVGDEFYFIDATTRLGLPSTASQLELWTNFSEIVWEGSNGNLIQPQFEAKFSAEVNLSVKADDCVWPTIELPDELKRWVKLKDFCQVDGVQSFPDNVADYDNAGWLVAIGDTPKEAVDRIKEYVDLLPDGLKGSTNELAEVIQEIEKEEQKGIKFTEQEMPQPEEAL